MRATGSSFVAVNQSRDARSTSVGEQVQRPYQGDPTSAVAAAAAIAVGSFQRLFSDVGLRQALAVGGRADC